MNETSAQGALAGKMAGVAQKKDAVYCPACGGDRMYRVERRGILRRRVYPIFGLYPWVCKECGNEVMLRKRNRRRHKRAHTE